MTDFPATRGARSEPQGAGEREESKSRRSLKNLFRLWRRRGGETDLRDAIEELIEESEDADSGEPALDSGESDLLLNVLKFGELTAYDVMVPRADIKAVAEDADLRGFIQTVREFGHSRLPVYGENLDDIIGVVHIKDALPSIFEPEKFQLKRILREPVFVAPSVRLLDLLLQMRAARAHMVLVVDEFGGTDGLVTIEDLLESLVGEIEDEHDEDDGPLVKKTEEGSFIADARVELDELRDVLGPDFDPGEHIEEVDTLGGLLFSLEGRVPVRGEVITRFKGFEFEVLAADARRIKRVRIMVKKRAARARPQALPNQGGAAAE